MSASPHLALLADVIITDELDRRTSRQADYQAEIQALSSLAESMGDNPGKVLQQIVDTTMALTNSDSAGISLLEPGGEQGTFRWVATAGAWSPYCNGTMPREESPCGEVITREAVLLLKCPERAFPALLQAQPGISEGLLAPFDIDGVPAGTLWTIKHNPDGHFDAEDARILTSLVRFASVAHQMARMVEGAQASQLESDTRLRALAHASSDVFYIMNPDMSELRRLSGGDFIADTVSPSIAWLRDYIPPEDQARVMTAIAEATRTKGVFELEHQVRQADGGIGWVLSRAVPILGPGGEIVEWFGAASDITARKLVEARLWNDQERQAFLLELSDALRAERSAEAIADLALRSLFEKMRLDRCYVGIYRLAEDIAEFPQQVHGDGLPPMPAQIRLSDFPESLRISFDRTLVVEDALEMAGFSESDRASFEGIGLRSVIAATLRKGENNPLWAIVVGSSGPRAWTPGEISLVEEVAERTWAAVERARAEIALRDSEERFQQFSDASANVLWIRNAATLRMEYASQAFDVIYGMPAPARGGDASLRPWLRLIEPESRKAVLANFRSVRTGEQAEIEFRVKRASDGALRWVHCTDFPLRDAAGKVAWLAGVGADITDSKEAADRQGILVAELQHRTRNLIAVVRSLSDRTLGNAVSLQDFGERFRLRLSALSRVQGLLSHLAVGQKVTFDELLRAELSAHGAMDGLANQVTLDGPSDVPLRSGTVQTLALALHELATNAVKYGALSCPDGHLAVRWHIEPVSRKTPAQLHVEWKESGVQMPAADARARGSGYGRELIERALPYQLKAKTRYQMGADGVRCTIAVPISVPAADGTINNGVGALAAVDPDQVV